MIISTKMRFYNECNDKRMCNRCYNQVNEIKDFDANLIFEKKQAADKFGDTLPYFKTYYDLFVIIRFL